MNDYCVIFSIIWEMCRMHVDSIRIELFSNELLHFLLMVYWIQNVSNVLFCPLCCWKAVADPQSLLEEKEAMEEKLALTAYELRLAQEDISKLKTELQKKSDLSLAELSGKLFHLLDINLSLFFVRGIFLDVVLLHYLLINWPSSSSFWLSFIM